MQLKDEAATLALGAKLAPHCQPPLVIHLIGELGSGKTTLARGLIQKLGHEGNVKSPTFSLVENYQFDFCKLCHFDLYRLKDPHELEYIGLRELCSEEDSICLIEWPDRGGQGVPSADFQILLAHEGEQRNVNFLTQSKIGQSIIDKI